MLGENSLSNVELVTYNFGIAPETDKQKRSSDHTFECSNCVYDTNRRTLKNTCENVFKSNLIYDGKDL
jgi:hypothetical protein